MNYIKQQAKGKERVSKMKYELTILVQFSTPEKDMPQVLPTRLNAFQDFDFFLQRLYFSLED